MRFVLLLLFACTAHAARPEDSLAPFVGDFHLVRRTRLPIEHANQDSRWDIVGRRDGRAFLARVVCVKMPMASNKYAYYTQIVCRPTAIDYL